MGSTTLVSEAAGTAASMPHASVAVAAADQFASRRIASALNAFGLSVVAHAPSAGELVHNADLHLAEVLVLACDPSSPEGLAGIRKLATGMGVARVVVVSSAPEGIGVRQALNAGADGVVNDSELDATLGPVAQAVFAGQLSLPRRLHRCVFRPAFSHREKQVLALVVAGAANRQIADHLFLAESTVKSHLASAFQKLGVRSRKEAAALLIDPDEGLGSSILGVQPAPPEAGGDSRGQRR